MYLGLTGLLYSLQQFESHTPTGVPRDCSQCISTRGLRGLLDHRGAIHTHVCFVLQAWVTEGSYVFAGYRTYQLHAAKV